MFLFRWSQKKLESPHGCFDIGMLAIRLAKAAKQRLALQPGAAASLLIAIAEGKMARFLRSGFRRLPDAEWPVQWEAIERIVFTPRPSGFAPAGHG